MVDEASHYCRYCGAEISGSDAFCMACGKQVATVSTQSQMSASQYQAPAHIEVPNYLFQALLTTLCCFPPLGIVAIVYSFQVNRKMKTGDHAGALEVSGKAKLWVIVAAVIGAIAWAIIMISEEPFK